jgi:hypothetical protein
MEVEFRGKRLGKRARPGVTSVNERAINIEKNQPNHP